MRPVRRTGIRPLTLIIAVTAYGWFAVYLPWTQMHCNDFKHIYLGMKALLDGDEPYSPQSLFHQAALNGMQGVALNPYVYLPFTGLAMAFLAPFQFIHAATIWFVLNHVFAIISCWLIARTLFAEATFKAFVSLLVALGLGHPFARTLTAGQLNLVLLLCLSGTFDLLMRGRDRAAGAVLGFAACFKIAPGLFALYLLLRRKWSALAAMLATIVVLMGISIAAFGWQTHLDFLPVLRQMRYGHSTWEQLQHPPAFWKDPANQSFNSLFTHLLVGDDAIRPWVHWSQSAANGLTIAASLLLLGAYLFASLSGREWSLTDANRLSVSDQALFQATILLALLLPSLMWDHYLTLTILPTAWLVRWCIDHRRWGVFRLVVACYLLIFIPWAYDSTVYRHGPALLLMSMKLFPAVILFGCCLLTAQCGSDDEEMHPATT